MTEIRIDVDLPHRQERVWRALTDPTVLREWFMDTRLGEDPATDGFKLRPNGQGGFDEPVDGEIIEVDGPNRLVMRWRAAQLRTIVAVTLQPSADGCRLTVLQQGFLGQQGSLRRRALQRTYGEMLGPRLRAALDRLAEEERERAYPARGRRAAEREAGWRNARQHNARRNEARFGSGVPRQASLAWAGLVAVGRNMPILRSSSAPGLSSRRRRRQPARGVAAPAGEALRESPTTPLSRMAWTRRRSAAGRRRMSHRRAADQALERPGVTVAACAAVLVLLAALAVFVERVTVPGAGARLGADSDPGGLLVPGVGSQARRDGGVVPSPLPVSSAPAGTRAAPLAATYHTERTVVGGYEGVVTINNLSSRSITEWTVRIVLPPLGLVVQEVRGAQADQNEHDVRFTPVPATRTVPPGESVRFWFGVRGVGAPLICTVNDEPCSGVPE